MSENLHFGQKKWANGHFQNIKVGRRKKLQLPKTTIYSGKKAVFGLFLAIFSPFLRFEKFTGQMATFLLLII